MNYWLIKSDPETYSWSKLLSDKETIWDGVRNYQARNYLASMEQGDLLLFYHSQETKDIVGLAKVSNKAFQDPTTQDERWLAVKIKPVKSITKPVSLTEIKLEPSLQNISLLKQSRLSVMPVTAEEFQRILEIGQTSL